MNASSPLPLPPGVTMGPGAGGLTCLKIDRAEAQGEIYLHGATVMSWTPEGEAPVLFVSPRAVFADAKPIRGGIPICFPWFGPKRDDANAPKHGLVRARPWRLESARALPDEQVEIVLGLSDDDSTRRIWAHRFELRYTVRMGRKLELELEVRNPGETSFTFEEALHPYFSVSDIRTVRVRGLEGALYLDKADRDARKRGEDGPVTFRGETDRVYIGTNGAVQIEDPGLARAIGIQKQASSSTIVWNPWSELARRLADLGEDAWTSMVCVEPANAVADAISLAPGASHRLSMRIVVNRLRAE